MSERVFQFSMRKRLKTAVWPLAVALGLLVMVGVFGDLSSYKTLLVLALAGFLLFRVGLAVVRVRRTRVIVHDDRLEASGVSVPFHSAELELRVRLHDTVAVLDTVVLWPPIEATDERRDGVGFDDALEDFAEAAKLLVAKMPDARIRVSAPGERQVRDERREQVLVPLRGELSPTAKLLSSLGPPKLPSPRLRN